MALPPEQIGPNCDGYPVDKEFPIHCNINYKEAYCCDVTDRFELDEFVGCTPDDGLCQIGEKGCNMTFPIYNDENQPMYKTALGGITKSAWVRIAFQNYVNGGNKESPPLTWKTILTMGNRSQPYNDHEECMAIIQGFRYGWGTTNEGNRCHIDILDQKGHNFQEWIQRMGINPEGDSVPVQGKYRMKVQFGWYVTGGADSDICGQPAKQLISMVDKDGNLISTPTPEGFNSAYIICGPVMYFLTDWINVRFENGKFKYELEGVDLLVRAQENLISKTYGKDIKKMYFTKAVEMLGRMSYPTFRAEFKCLNAEGKVVDMQFVQRDGNFDDRACNECLDCSVPCTQFFGIKKNYNYDCQGWGPYDVWETNSSTPLTCIQNWIKKGVVAKDLSGKITSSGFKTGITMNYDSTFKFQRGQIEHCPPPCDATLPQYGRLLLWGNSIPYCQGNFNDDEINKRLKAVYIVNGGNCLNGNSTVLTEDGWERIEKLFKFKYSGKVACVDENGTSTWSEVNNWYRNNLNNRKLIKIHLHNSRQRSGSISGAIFTEDHPVLTDSGYVEVKDLRITEDLIHSGTYCPSQEVHEAVIGMILGDGYIRNKSYSFNCTHCGAQKDYIEYKAELLNLKTIDKPDKKIKITSKANPYWRSLRKLFYPEGTKVINKVILKDFSIISLAFLYMDDGSLRQEKKLAEIATCFTKEEVDLLIARIKELGINCYRRENSKYPRIYFNVKETIKLCNAIAPYIISSMDYKLLPEYRLENKNKLNLEERSFYDTFDLIRCEKLEKTTKYVYCIGVEKYNNFMTHSGVAHNCSPVISFNPSFRWRQTAAMRTGATGNPAVTSTAISPGGLILANALALVPQVLGIVKVRCAIASTPGIKRQTVPMATRSVPVSNNPAQMTQEAVYHQIMTNMAIGVIEATLRVQGDPSSWLCSPIAGMGRCVGIVFINPYFLVGGEEPNNDCPIWAADDPDNLDKDFKSICNKLLTNKGWFLMGVDHQIKDGQYTTDLRLRLVAPGGEINPAGSVVNLGAWENAEPLPFGGQFGCLEKNLVGTASAGWALAPDGSGTWLGGGTLCGSNYTNNVPLPIPPEIDE